MKYNKKLWKKFLINRVYGWDLIKMNGDGENKIVRFVKGDFINEFRGDDDKQVSIPTHKTNSNLQIHYTMRKLNWIDAFILARKLCESNSEYRISIGYIIKELRGKI